MNTGTQLLQTRYKESLIISFVLMTASWAKDTMVTLQFKSCFNPLCLSHVSFTYIHISVRIEAIYIMDHTHNCATQVRVSVFQTTRVDRLCIKSGSLHLLSYIYYVVKLKSMDVTETRAIHQLSFQGKFVLHCTSYPYETADTSIAWKHFILTQSSALLNFQTPPWHSPH